MTMRELKFSRGTFDNENKFRVEGVRGDVSLKNGYEKEGDGILWGMQHGTLIKSFYTDEDKAHTERMKNYHPIQDGEEVSIDGQVFVARILGNYSDCVIFDPKNN